MERPPCKTFHLLTSHLCLSAETPWQLFFRRSANQDVAPAAASRVDTDNSGSRAQGPALLSIPTALLAARPKLRTMLPAHMLPCSVNNLLIRKYVDSIIKPKIQRRGKALSGTSERYNSGTAAVHKQSEQVTQRQRADVSPRPHVLAAKHVKATKPLRLVSTKGSGPLSAQDQATPRTMTPSSAGR